MWYLIAVFLLISLAEAGVTVSLYRSTGLYPSFGIILMSLVAGCFIEVLYSRVHKTKNWTDWPKDPNTYEFHYFSTCQMVRWHSILLLFFPGILTDLLGMILLLTPVQTRVVKHMADYSWQSFQKLPKSKRATFLRKSRKH